MKITWGTFCAFVLASSVGWPRVVASGSCEELERLALAGTTITNAEVVMQKLETS